MPKDDIENLIEIALKNIQNDRVEATSAISEINSYLQKLPVDPESYSKIMMSYSKIIENLQKGNEQIINIVNIKTKTKPKPDDTLNMDEIESIYKK
jgi:hypothetical protein